MNRPEQAPTYEEASGEWAEPGQCVNCAGFPADHYCEAQARPEQDRGDHEAVRLREALARLVEHHQDAMGHGPSCKRLDEARAALATPPPATPDWVPEGWPIQSLDPPPATQEAEPLTIEELQQDGAQE